jgi:hypothetical protein
MLLRLCSWPVASVASNFRRMWLLTHKEADGADLIGLAVV